MKPVSASIDDKGRTQVNVSGMSRRTFVNLLASTGVAAVATTIAGRRVAYAEDGSEVAELQNVPYTDEEIGAGLQAASDGLLLGMWFNYTGDVADSSSFYNTLTVSSDGRFFEVLGTPYTSRQNPFHDPAIFYKSGYFWTISNWDIRDGKFWPMFGFSRDLKTWTAPEGATLINNGNYSGITMSPAAPGNQQIVAPDAFVDDDGSVYIVFSAGTYEHYNASTPMVPYIVKLEGLTASGMSGSNAQGLPYPNGLSFTPGVAQQIDLSAVPSANRIDPSLYKEGGTYYLSIKRDGLNNEVWRNSKPSATGWTLVKDNLSYGNEGPSLVKFNNKWFLYTDKVTSANNGQTGIQVSTGSSIAGLGAKQDIVAIDIKRNLVHLRHGSVMNVTDPSALAVVKSAYASAGWTAEDAPHAWFSDVNGHWSKTAAYYCADRGLINGMGGGTTFAPDVNLSRAQAAVILWRFFDSTNAAAYDANPVAQNRSGCTDIAANTWYTGAVNWASGAGIMNGNAGLFNPDGDLTREQLFKIVAESAAKYCGATIEGASTAKMDTFPDAASVSPWARKYAAWALNNNVIGGSKVNGTSYIVPQGTVTRGQMATVMMNAIKNGVIYR